jgi:hypothetical protein
MQRSVLLKGAVSFGVWSWFAVDRAGYGFSSLIIQLVSIPLMLVGVGFVSFFLTWILGMYIPQYIVRSDMMEDALYDKADESARAYERQLEEGTSGTGGVGEIAV